MRNHLIKSKDTSIPPRSAITRNSSQVGKFVTSRKRYFYWATVDCDQRSDVIRSSARRFGGAGCDDLCLYHENHFAGKAMEKLGRSDFALCLDWRAIFVSGSLCVRWLRKAKKMQQANFLHHDDKHRPRSWSAAIRRSKSFRTRWTKLIDDQLAYVGFLQRTIKETLYLAQGLRYRF